MAANVYYEADADPLDHPRSRRSPIIGYGSQGHAHALNLKESGVDVVRRAPRRVVVGGQGRVAGPDREVDRRRRRVGRHR